MLASFLYLSTLPGGLTWAYQGADGGELLAAAVTNGVPHPPGYPLYMLILQGWLALLTWLAPTTNLAQRGSLLSVLCAAISTGFTVQTAIVLLKRLGCSNRWSAVWAGTAGSAWAITPLLWSQAVITEVYALHMLFVAILGWWCLTQSAALWPLIPLIALGLAHHLTFSLLLPAVFYWKWRQTEHSTPRYLWQALTVLFLGCAISALFQLRTWLAAQGMSPVNWGLADNPDGLWWLVSGAAYRGYFFGGDSGTVWQQLANWAYTITDQFTPFGLALSLLGFALLDQQQPHLRNFSILWIVPISLYSVSYFTRDSDIYLLPVIWLMVLWLAIGLPALADRLVARLGERTPYLLSLLAILGVLALAAWRWPQISLRNETEARQFVTAAAAVLKPGDIVISRNDAASFALWYGAWASAELPGDLVLVNDALYQFEWYRRLQQRLHPDVPGIALSIDELLKQNRGQRLIYLAEADMTLVAEELLSPMGNLWLYR
jgi:hypothetical protein